MDSFRRAYSLVYLCKLLYLMLSIFRYCYERASVVCWNYDRIFLFERHENYHLQSCESQFFHIWRFPFNCANNDSNHSIPIELGVFEIWWKVDFISSFDFEYVYVLLVHRCMHQSDHCILGHSLLIYKKESQMSMMISSRNLNSCPSKLKFQV